MTRRWVAALAGLVTAVLAVWLVVRPPAFIWARFADELPSPVAGDPVPPIAGSPEARIAVAGDTGTGDDAQRATAEQMVAQQGKLPFDGLLLLGDPVYEVGDAELTDDVVTEPFAQVLDGGAALLPVLGNHDYESGEQEQILAALGRQRSWYVDRLGPVRVVVLATVKLDEPDQTDWLRQSLDRAQPPGSWTVVALHHPPYSAGLNASDLDVRDTWAPLFAEAGVALVLAGHAHDYQRSEPQDGVTYVVSGAAAKLDPTGSEEFTAVSASTLHFLDLLFYDDRIVGRAIDQSGNLVDTFTIR